MNFLFWFMKAKVCKVESCTVYFALHFHTNLWISRHFVLITHDAIKSVNSSIDLCASDVWACADVDVWPCGPTDVWKIHALELWTCGALKVWTCGPLELWTIGHVELWKCGHVDLWRCGQLGMWSFGSVDRWARGPFGSVDMWACGPEEVRTCEFVDLKRCRHVVDLWKGSGETMIETWWISWFLCLGYTKNIRSLYAAVQQRCR